MNITRAEYGKLPPQAVEVEQFVLGSVLVETNAIVRIIDILKPSCFYQDANQKIFQACIDLYTKSKPIDLLTVTEQLKINGILDEIGGAYYISSLTSSVGSTANLEHHTKIVYDKYVARELIRIGADIQDKSFRDDVDINDLIEYSQSQLFALISTNKECKSIAEIGKKRINELIKISELKTQYTGVPSGFAKLDRITSGWQKTDLIIVAGRPSMGKSTIALEFGVNAAKIGMPTDIYSLEMNDSQLFDKVLSRKTKIENSFIRTAKMEGYQWEKIMNFEQEIYNYKLWIDETPALSILEFRAKARRNKEKHGTELIIIDYIQLMRNPDVFKKGNREQEVSSISAQLKATAKELQVPIIALSQMNRGVESRGGEKRPQLSDLRESGAIEQDADMVVFVHRPEYYNIHEDSEGISTEGKIDIIIAKHRNGAIGDISLWKNKNWTEINEHKDSEYVDFSLPYNESNDDKENLWT